MSDPLAPFRARFVARAREEIEVLRQAADGAAPEADVRTIVHRMAGLAGTVGYGEISRLAAEVDDRLHAGGAIPRRQLQALISALEALPSQP